MEAEMHAYRSAPGVEAVRTVLYGHLTRTGRRVPAARTDMRDDLEYGWSWSAVDEQRPGLRA